MFKLRYALYNTTCVRPFGSAWSPSETGPGQEVVTKVPSPSLLTGVSDRWLVWRLESRLSSEHVLLKLIIRLVSLGAVQFIRLKIKHPSPKKFGSKYPIDIHNTRNSFRFRVSSRVSNCTRFYIKSIHFKLFRYDYGRITTTTRYNSTTANKRFRKNKTGRVVLTWQLRKRFISFRRFFSLLRSRHVHILVNGVD